MQRCTFGLRLHWGKGSRLHLHRGKGSRLLISCWPNRTMQHDLASGDRLSHMCSAPRPLHPSFSDPAVGEPRESAFIQPCTVMDRRSFSIISFCRKFPTHSRRYASTNQWHHHHASTNITTTSHCAKPHDCHYTC